MNDKLYENDLEDSLSFSDTVAIFRRRKWALLITSTSIALLAILIAFFWPATFTSQATILIEEQEVPREFVTSTVTSYAAQQIQVISQRVLTAESIARISDKFGLFVDAETNRRPPATEIAIEFRDLMALELVSADVIDPRSGRPREATIAFTLAFDHKSPRTAQQVTNELVTLFLDENLRTRSERVRSTEQFLGSQATTLNRELKELEERIAEFKRENSGALPELYQYNLSSLERRSAEYDDIDRRLRELIRVRIELNSKLELMNPSSQSIGIDGRPVMDDRERMELLQRELNQKLTIYHEQHPDIVALKRQLEDLTQPTNGSGSSRANAVANNPSYVLLSTQLNSIDAERQALSEKKFELSQKISEFESLLSKSPMVERDYSALQRDYQGVQSRYQEVRSKQRSAELAENMEQERKGERFLLVEPPNLPVEPSSPNRPAIAVLGILLAAGAGLALVLILEAIDGGIYTEKALTRLVGVPPFAVVGYIETESEMAHRSKLRRRFLLAVGLTMIAILLVLHFLIQPLDVMWFRFLNLVSGS